MRRIPSISIRWISRSRDDEREVKRCFSNLDRTAVLKTGTEGNPGTIAVLHGDGFNNHLRSLARHAQASVKSRNEPPDGDNYGYFPTPLDLLRLADCFATRDRMERDRSMHQFSNRRCIRMMYSRRGVREARLADNV